MESELTKMRKGSKRKRASVTVSWFHCHEASSDAEKRKKKQLFGDLVLVISGCNDPAPQRNELYPSEKAPRNIVYLLPAFSCLLGAKAPLSGINSAMQRESKRKTFSATENNLCKAKGEV